MFFIGQEKCETFGFETKFGESSKKHPTAAVFTTTKLALLYVPTY
jgi:hypothetical protein